MISTYFFDINDIIEKNNKIIRKTEFLRNTNFWKNLFCSISKMNN